MLDHGVNPTTEVDVYSCFVERFDDVATLKFPTQNVVLLVADANEESVNVLSQVGDRLVRNGIVYFCAWGPNCERVHDVVDGSAEALLEDGQLITTWHESESLEEALWFFLNCAFPLDSQFPDVCHLAIVIGRRDWLDSVRELLADIERFNERMLNDPDQ